MTTSTPEISLPIKTGLSDQEVSPTRVKRGRPADPNAVRRILHAAAASFMERGFAGASIDEIAKAAGATKGFVYSYFDSKADLYFAILIGSTERISARVRAEFERDLPPAEKLRCMAYAHMCSILTDFPAAKVGVQGLERSFMLSASQKERHHMRSYIGIRDDYEAMFTTVITEGIRQGALQSGTVALLAKGLLGSLNWVTLWFDPDRSTSAEKIEEIARTLADYSVRGLLR